jgi:hypothetical protein
MFRKTFLIPGFVMVLLVHCVGLAAAADDASKPASLTNKLTASYYGFSSGKNGFDINLRTRSNPAQPGSATTRRPAGLIRLESATSTIITAMDHFCSISARSHPWISRRLVYGEVGHERIGIVGFGGRI